MIQDREKFAADLMAMGLAIGPAMTPQKIGVYERLVRPQLTDQQWAKVAAEVLADATLGRIPTPAQLVDRGKGGNEGLLAEAGRAFEAVKECRDYSPVNGATWDPGRIRDELGEACLAGFRAIGGGRRLRDIPERDLPFVLKAFQEAYLEARKGGHPALPPMPAPPKALPPSPDFEPITDGEAKALVGRIEDHMERMS